MEMIYASLPFHAIPTIVMLVAIILMCLRKSELGVRKVGFGVGGFALLIIHPIATQLAQLYFASSTGRGVEDVASMWIRLVVIGGISSVVYGATMWLLYMAITYRKQARNDREHCLDSF